VNLAEAEALLGPDLCAQLRAEWGPPTPLSPDQIALCTELLAPAPDNTRTAA